MDSDVQAWRRHPMPHDEHSAVVGFPVGGAGPFLCTQGEGGALTHFFSGNLHAVDFRCAVGTPLLAVRAGTVVEVAPSRYCYCSPHHIRIPFNSRNDGSKCVSMTWRAISARP